MIREIYPPSLFLGNAFDARDLRLLYDHRIAAVVDLAANEPPAQLGRDIIYFRIPLVDGDGNLALTVEMAIRCLALLVEKEVRTLVACSAGMSRSPAIAAGALAVLTNEPFEECLIKMVAGAPHDVSPPLWRQVVMACHEILRSGPPGSIPS